PEQAGRRGRLGGRASFAGRAGGEGCRLLWGGFTICHSREWPIEDPPYSFGTLPCPGGPVWLAGRASDGGWSGPSLARPANDSTARRVSNRANPPHNKTAHATATVRPVRTESHSRRHRARAPR